MGETKHERNANGKRCVWQKTPIPHLLKYVPKGSYYIRKRVRGAILRQALGTTDYQVARFRLSERLRELRTFSSRDDYPHSLAEALAVVGAQIKNDPSLKESTRRSYAEELDNLKPGWPAAVPNIPLPKLRAPDMEEWWTRAAHAYAPQRANHLLGFVRRAFKLAHESGGVFHNPSAKLKPVKIPRTRLELPAPAIFRNIVASVRAQGKAHSQEAADWIAFAAFSGIRPSEILAIQWADVRLADGVILVYGGAQGTKNREPRRVPIIEAMGALLKRMRKRAQPKGPLFRIKRPTDALRNACRRLDLPHMRIYDLRHVYASRACAAGVDMPTIAHWMGHKDGGTLAMRTYIHTTDEHSRLAAAKVKF